jgi:lysophospholipase L1-like esterase
MRTWQLSPKLVCLWLAVATAVTTTASTQKAPAQKVVFLGDAATHNWGLPANSSAFQANPKWINKGLAGRQTSTELLARFATDVVAQRPAIVHILAGAVDISLVDTANRPFLIQVFQTNLVAMVAEASHANIKVILGTIPPQLITESVQQPQTSLVFEPDLIQSLNAWIEAFGAENGIPVINYHDVLCSCVGSTNPGPSGYYPLMASDGASPSPAGYAAITPLAAMAIATLNLSMRSGYVSNPDHATTMVQGDSLLFTAYGVFSDGIPRPLLNTNFAGSAGNWASNNPTVLYVGYNGEAYAYAPGEATITFTSLSGIPFSQAVVTVLPAN